MNLEDMSMSDKLTTAERLAARLCDSGVTVPPEKVYLVQSYANGSVRRYHVSRISGKCSLAAILTYDIGHEDDKITEDVVLFTRFLDEAAQ